MQSSPDASAGGDTNTEPQTEHSPPDVSHLYPPPASMEHALTHLGTSLSAGSPWTPSGWESSLDPDSQLCPLPTATSGTGRSFPLPHHDQCVTILHAKVAQKSYGNEKRFFCPPPCVYISGSGWKVQQDHLKATGYGAAACVRLRGSMGLDGSCSSQADTFKLNFDEQPNTQMFACAKSLYISDTDKRKHFRLQLHLFMGGAGGQEVGSFQSRMIKVISKPSQKRQSMKNADLCISSGSRVALFNRLRSQTVSTRYLSVERAAFVASARQWTAFTISLVEQQHAPQGEFKLCDGFICYGCVVQLICTNTGVALPPMVIRKVNKQHAILDVDEPVSQLHKCAFHFRDEPSTYLCLSNDHIVQYQAPLQGPSGLKEQGREVLNDGSCWTIIGVETVEYAFNQDMAGRQALVSPVPVITGLEVNGGGHVATLELQGEDFSPHLKVCFGRSEAETMFKSPRSLLCVVPDVSTFGGGWRCVRRALTVPLCLLRSDGLVYRSPYSFTYTPELHAAPSAPSDGGGGRGGDTEARRDSDDLLDSIHHEFTRANLHLFMQS